MTGVKERRDGLLLTLDVNRVKKIGPFQSRVALRHFFLGANSLFFGTSDDNHYHFTKYSTMEPYNNITNRIMYGEQTQGGIDAN